MEIIFEFALRLAFWLFEILFSVVGEALFDWGRNKKAGKTPQRETTDQRAGPLLTALAYVAFGALCGSATLWIAPTNFIASPALRWLNLLVAPLIAGFLLAHWRAFNAAPGKPTDFAADGVNGALLAFALSVTRFAFAR